MRRAHMFTFEEVNLFYKLPFNYGNITIFIFIRLCLVLSRVVIAIIRSTITKLRRE